MNRFGLGPLTFGKVQPSYFTETAESKKEHLNSAMAAEGDEPVLHATLSLTFSPRGSHASGV